MSEPMKYYRRGMFLGTWLTSILTCLLQDYLGLDAYVQWVTDSWVNVPWGVWLIVLLVWGVFATLMRPVMREL